MDLIADCRAARESGGRPRVDQAQEARQASAAPRLESRRAEVI
jgi:hypothetical protein